MVDRGLCHAFLELCGTSLCGYAMVYSHSVLWTLRSFPLFAMTIDTIANSLVNMLFDICGNVGSGEIPKSGIAGVKG